MSSDASSLTRIGHDLARQAAATSPRVRGYARQFAAINVNDGSNTTYWATDDNVTTGSVELTWSAPITLRSHRPAGSHRPWSARRGLDGDAEVEGDWTSIAQGTTIGHKRIARVDARDDAPSAHHHHALPSRHQRSSTVGVYGR